MQAYNGCLCTEASGSRTNTAAANLDSLVPGENQADIQAKIDSAFKALGGTVDVFLVDARTCEPFGKDPIWEVPLGEWDQHHDAALVQRRQILFHVKSLLQYQLQRSKKGNSLGPFSVVILGYRNSFDSALGPVISKLQRDVSWLHREAYISFLDVASSGGEVSEQSIAAAVGILVSTKAGNIVTSLNDLWSLRGSHATESSVVPAGGGAETQFSILPALSVKRPKVKIALSFDYDALSAFLGTGEHPDNNLADYSTGVFSGRVGGLRLLRMLEKYQVADKVTWFIPGHTMETFESTIQEIVKSGAEIALHGYAHEGAYQMTPAQERDVLVKCMEVSQRLTGKKVQGWRAPMYQLRETTIELLKEFGFLYDSSLSHHDSQPYFTPSDAPVERIDFSKPASSWLRPTPLAAMDIPVGYPLVEIPIGWNNEDMMALQYFPHVANTNGQVDARVVEQRWKDMFLWLWENAEAESDDGTFIFPLLMHPDTSGQAHVMAMADRFVAWLKGWGDSVEFHTYASIAHDFLHKKGI